MANLTESIVENATLARLESLGYTVKHGPDISPVGDTLTPTLSQWERENYSEVVLADRWRQLLQKIQQLRKKQCAKNAYCFFGQARYEVHLNVFAVVLEASWGRSNRFQNGKSST